MAKRKVFLNKNQKLFNRARRFLVGGVNSPVRAFDHVGARPLLIRQGKGARVFDYAGKEYVDYVLSWGASILGHAHPLVLKGLKDALDYGLGFGTTHINEIKLAELIHSAIPFLEKMRFTNSGTEAVMGAVRLARGYTGREKIVKFNHAYHGHADYLLAKGGSGLATLQIPSSEGVPKDFIKHTIIAPQYDLDYLKRLFKRQADKIAAVLIEPVGANYGVIPPDKAFLEGLRKLTKSYGILLIFDEVITGFRFHFGSIAQKLNITPDLICLGKIIGGGLPIGAYAGRERIMRKLAPLGKVYQASTFSGNPIVMQAGITTLKILQRNQAEFIRIRNLAEYLIRSIKRESFLNRVDLEVNDYENMFSLKFNPGGNFKKFYRFLLNDGIFLAPSEFEANFLSFAHTKKDIDKTIDAAGRAFKKI